MKRLVIVAVAVFSVGVVAGCGESGLKESKDSAAQPRPKNTVKSSLKTCLEDSGADLEVKQPASDLLRITRAGVTSVESARIHTFKTLKEAKAFRRPLSIENDQWDKRVVTYDSGRDADIETAVNACMRTN